MCESYKILSCVYILNIIKTIVFYEVHVQAETLSNNLENCEESEGTLGTR
jgi:hypothetical protein